MDKAEFIMSGLKEHKDEIARSGHHPIYLALQGSQNYNLDTEESDIDTKTMIMPTLKEIALGSNVLSTTFVLKNNEHCDLKDVRLMINTICKQNINFLEILFTPYFLVDEKYSSLIHELRKNSERIARFDEAGAAKCIMGTAREKYKAMEHTTPISAEKIARYGYDGKQLHHLVRMAEFFERYTHGETYRNCLISRHHDFLISLKKNELSLDEARKLADATIKDLESQVTSFLATAPTRDLEVKEYLDDWLVRLFRKGIN